MGMNKLSTQTMRLVPAHTAEPVIVHTEQSEAGAWFRWTQRYEGARGWAEMRPLISLQ